MTTTIANTINPRMRLLLIISTSLAIATSTTSAPLPNADPSVYDELPSNILLEISFLGHGISDIRYYLANHRTETIEGQFSRASMLGQHGKWQEAADAYTKVIEDPRSKGRIRAVAAGNRAYCGTSGGLEHETELNLQAIRVAFAEGDLDQACILSVSEETKETWEEMFDKYPEYAESKKAAFLLCNARYHFHLSENYDQCRKNLSEIWAMELNEWHGTFEVGQLLKLWLSEELYGKFRVEERLTMGGMANKLFGYQQFVHAKEKDPVRRAAVAGWCNTYASKLFNADTRHWRYGQLAIQFLQGGGAGSLGIFPSADASNILVDLWYKPRDGTQLIDLKTRRQAYDLDDIVKMMGVSPAIPDPNWYLDRAKFLSRLGRYDEAESSVREAAKRAFHPSSKEMVLAVWNDYVLAFTTQDSSNVARELERLLGSATPTGRREICLKLSRISFGGGDIAAARKWMEQFAKEENASAAFVEEKLETIKSVEELLAERQRYLAANPLEEKWNDQVGRTGIAVQLNFATNSDKLPSNAGSALAPVAKVLEDPSYRNLVFRIEGHTDSTGNDAINEPLSLRRAQSVAEYLRQNHGVTDGRIEVDGFGSRRPIASNLSESGRAKNRRAELNLMGDASQPQLVASGTLVNDIATVSPDGRLLLSSNGDVWDTRNWVRLYSVPVRRASNPRGARFSPDGRYLFHPAFDRILYTGLLIDAKTGVLVDFIPCPQMTKGMFSPVWSPDSKKVAFTTQGGCFVYDIEKKRLAGGAALPTPDRNPAIAAWIKGGQEIALAALIGSGNLYVMDSSDFDVRQVSVPEIGYLQGMVSSHDARYLYIAEDRGAIIDWDTLTEEAPSIRPFIRDALAEGVRFTHTVEVHPGNPRLVAATGYHTDHWGIVDFENEKVSWDRDSGGKKQIDAYWGWDGDEVLLSGGWTANAEAKREGAPAVSGLYRLRLQDEKEVSNTELEFITGASARLWSLIAYPELDSLVSFTTEDTSVWDVKTGRQVHSWSGGLTWYAAASKEVPGVFFGVVENPVSEETTLFRFDLNTFQRTTIAELGNFDISSMASGKGALLVAGRRYLPTNQGTEEVTLQVLDPESGRVLAQKDVTTVTEALRYERIYYSGFANCALSPSGETVAFVTNWADGYGHGVVASKQARIWNWRTGEESVVKSSKRIESVHFESDKVLRVSANKAWSDWTAEVSSGEFRDENLDRKTRPNMGNTVELEKAFEDRNLKIEFSERGEIRFIRRDLDKVEVTVLKKGEEWIAYNDEGYFYATPNGTEKVFWRVGTRMLPLEALRDKFENAALIADSMKAIFEKKEVNVPGDIRPTINPELFSIPYELEVLSATNVESSGDTYTMKVRVKTLTPDAPAPEFVWSMNGHSGRGFKVVPAKVEPRLYTGQHEFVLGDGTNVLTVSLRYKGAEVMPQHVIVRRPTAKPPSPGTVASKTHLWFFGVGVKDYVEVDQNLDYADKDARELAAMLSRQEGKLFQKVHTKVLTNEEATTNSIRIEMNRFLRQASAQDLIVIFIAGHGVVSSDEDLYFVAHDSDADEAYTGLEIRFFAEFLERRPLNQKALFLMDICHAGTFGSKSKRRGSGITAEDAVKLIEQGTGTVVFASSTGREYSLEDEEFRGGHGAFTAALLDGLEGKADRDAGDGNGYIFLSELTNFVSREVPRLTRGAQHPTMPKSENLRDFPLGKAAE